MSPQRDEPLGGAGLHRHGVPRVPRAQARHQPGRVHHERQHHTVRNVHLILTTLFPKKRLAAGWTCFLGSSPEVPSLCPEIQIK